MLESIKGLLVVIVDLLKGIKHELHENNERCIKDGAGHIGVPIKAKGVIASKESYVIPPCFRIEFDAIHDVPKVYVNGVDITDTEHNNIALQELNVDWVTDDYCKRPKRFYLKYIDSHGTHRIIDRGNMEGGVRIDG